MKTVIAFIVCLSGVAIAQPVSPAAICFSSGMPTICPATAIAPNVTGLTQAAAATAITAAGLTVGTVTSVPNATIAVGLVVNQSAVGVVVAKSSVNLILSSGPAAGGITPINTVPIATLAASSPGALYITLDGVNALVICVAGFASPGCPAN